MHAGEANTPRARGTPRRSGKPGGRSGLMASARIEPRHDVAHERQGRAGPRRCLQAAVWSPEGAPSASHPPGPCATPQEGPSACAQGRERRWAPRVRHASPRQDSWPRGATPPGGTGGAVPRRVPGRGVRGKGWEGKGGRGREGGRGRRSFLHTSRQAPFSRILFFFAPLLFSSLLTPPTPREGGGGGGDARHDTSDY